MVYSDVITDHVEEKILYEKVEEEEGQMFQNTVLQSKINNKTEIILVKIEV